MITPTQSTLGEVAYDAYWDALPNVRAMMKRDWRELSPETKQRWEDTAFAVRTAEAEMQSREAVDQRLDDIIAAIVSFRAQGDLDQSIRFHHRARELMWVLFPHLSTDERLQAITDRSKTDWSSVYASIMENQTCHSGSQPQTETLGTSTPQET